MKVYAKGSVVVDILIPMNEVINSSIITVVDSMATTVDRKDPTMTAIVLVIGNVVGDTIIAGMRVVGTNVVGMNVVGK